MSISIPAWFFPIVISAVGLGFYDICKKHAVRDNSVMPVLFLATLSGSLLFVIGTLLFGDFAGAIVCSPHHWMLLLGKSLFVAMSHFSKIGYFLVMASRFGLLKINRRR